MLFVFDTYERKNMEVQIFDGIEIPEEQANWENIQFTKSYGVGIDHIEISYRYVC